MSNTGRSSPGALEFRRRDAAGRASSTLSELVDDTVSLDVNALAARVLVRPPNTPGETLFREILCKVKEEPLDEARLAAATRRAATARDARDAAVLLRAALREAVDRALFGRRRVAVMTGGGLDSAGLLALAAEWARNRGGSVFAVALDYGGPGDDRPHLRALERALGCEVVRMAPEAAAASVDWYDGVDAAPLAWPTAPMEIALLRQARANGAECVLGGAGGDQLFDGAPRSLASLARRGRPLASLRAARRLRGFSRPRSPVLSWVIRPLAASMLPRALRRALASRPVPFEAPWVGPALREWERRRREEAFHEAYEAEERRAIHAAAEDARYREYLFYLSHQEAVAADVAVSEPYLDPLLTTFVRALPREWLLFGSERRGLFREALRGLLPESVRSRQDKADFEPALDRFVAAAGALESLRECSAGKELAAFGFVEPSAFVEAFARFASTSTRVPSDWVTFWPALCVEAFLVGRSRRAAA